MTTPAGHDRQPDRRRPSRHWLRIAALGAALVLAACGEESDPVTEDRKFANDPVTAAPATETPAPTSVVSPQVTEPPVVTASPETLLSSRGTPGTLYTVDGGQLIAIGVDGSDASITPILDPGEADIVDIASAPSGDRVAVLLGEPDGATSLRVLAADGEAVVEDTTVFPATATPASSAETDPARIHWSPQGDSLLVMTGNDLSAVSLGGEIREIDLSGLAGDLQDARLSPDGGRIALQMVDDDGATAVYIHMLEDGRSREVTALGTTDQHGITNLQWLPDGSGLVYMRGTLVQGIPMRGQLYRYTLGQEVPVLLATSGQGGPSATITDAAVSPDGRKVAYVISVLDGGRWAYHSMWVRSLQGSLEYSVPVGRAGVVVDPAWIDGGIAWEQRPEQHAPGTWRLITASGQITTLYDAAPAVTGTPGATPVGTPGATPAGRPGATPAGSPAATPEPGAQGGA